jgi:hypothetical protein
VEEEEEAQRPRTRRDGSGRMGRCGRCPQGLRRQCIQKRFQRRRWLMERLRACSVFRWGWLWIIAGNCINGTDFEVGYWCPTQQRPGAFNNAWIQHRPWEWRRRRRHGSLLSASRIRAHLSAIVASSRCGPTGMSVGFERQRGDGGEARMWWAVFGGIERWCICFRCDSRPLFRLFDDFYMVIVAFRCLGRQGG